MHEMVVKWLCIMVMEPLRLYNHCGYVTIMVIYDFVANIVWSMASDQLNIDYQEMWKID